MSSNNLDISLGNHQSEQGQNLVEFALVVGLVIVVFLGMVEMTNLFQQKADLDNVVRQAARQAGEFGGGKDQISAYIQHQLGLLEYDTSSILITVTAQTLDSDGVIRDITPETDICTYGEYISVQIMKEWEAEFLMTVGIFLTQNRMNGTFNVVHTNRCWRAD